MLRGLRKASSNWLGKAVMAAVVGFLVISFAIWGIGDIFRGFGRSTVAKIGHTEITIEQFRGSTTTGCSRFPPARPPDRPGPGPRAWAWTAWSSDSSSPKSCSTSARVCSGLRSPTPRWPSRSRGSRLPRAERPVRPLPLRADHPHRRLQRAPFRRRAAPPDAAAAARGNDRVGIEAAEGRCRGGSTAIRTSSARSNTCCSTARRPARSRRPPRRCSPSISRNARSCFARPNTASWWSCP